MAHATLRTVEGHCVRQRVSSGFLLPCLAVLFATFAATEVSAAILGSSIEVGLSSRLANDVRVSDDDSDSQGATTNPLAASVAQRNEWGGQVVDHTITATATFASQSRGGIRHTYNSYYSNPVNPPNDVAFGFEQYGYSRLNFTADSNELAWAYRYTQGVWPFDARYLYVDLYGPDNAYWGWDIHNFVPANLPAASFQTRVPLQPGGEYRLEFGLGGEGGWGAGGQLGPDNRYSYDYEFVWTTEGDSQLNPVLPDVQPPAPPFIFTDVLGGRWYDPPVATGYAFETTDGSLFTSILDFPTGFNSLFTVTAGGNVLGQFGPGQPVDFVSRLGGGVSAFTISGIDPPTDPSDTLGFPIRLEFNNAIADFTMTPLTSEGVIPEPSSLLLWAVGSSIVAGFGWRKRRRCAAC